MSFLHLWILAVVTCCMLWLGNSLGLTDKCSIGPRMGCWRAPIVYTSSTGIYSTVANQPTDARRPEHSDQRLFSSSGWIRVVRWWWRPQRIVSLISSAKRELGRCYSRFPQLLTHQRPRRPVLDYYKIKPVSKILVSLSTIVFYYFKSIIVFGTCVHEAQSKIVL